MKRVLWMIGIALLACSTSNCVGGSLSASATPESTPKDTAGTPVPTPTLDPRGRNLVYVTPFCTLRGHGNTQTESYGNAFELSWGWKASTRQQVLDYLESAVTKVTFNGTEITDAKRTDITADGGAYHVYWEKSLGVLARGKYGMTFFEKYNIKISDGWNEFGPGTGTEAVEDTCYLVVD